MYNQFSLETGLDVKGNVLHMEIYAWLSSHGIEYQRFCHPALYTCEDAARLAPEMRGLKAKNLFLRDRRGRRHLLLVLRAEQHVDLRELGSRLQTLGLRFASPQRLQRYLQVAPGAVSLLALINDVAVTVEVVMDKILAQSVYFQCHPLINTATLVLDRANLDLVLQTTGHTLKVMEMPTK